MRILILANIDGGLYKFRRELLENLVKEHEVFFTVPNGDYIEKIKDIGCKYIECTAIERRGKNPIQDLKLLYFYINTIKLIKPNIVFTYTIKPNVYGGMACAILGIPYIVNITGLGSAVENGGVLQKLTLFLYKLGIRKAQKVFFQNAENRDFMIKHGVVRGAYDLLPGSGVNLDQYKVFPYPNSDIIDFVFIARVMKEKGIDHYLDAAEYFHAKYEKTRFHVCGGCEEEHYKNKLSLLHEKGIIVYHGSVSDMIEIYKMISCTVHPTYYPEGLSNVLLESAACARPIITTNRSGCKEVVDNGVNGFLVEQKDSKDLISKIERFINLSYEQRKQMGLAGRKKVENNFDRKFVIKKYINEINNMGN